MTVLRIVRFKTDPENAQEMLAARETLIKTVRDKFPGLHEARLGKIDDLTYIDVWRWEELANVQAAIAAVPTMPEAGAAFKWTYDSVGEFAEVVAEN